MASIEGRRGTPRLRPPYPTERGLWGRPTMINNVETLANIPTIMRKGADWFSSIGTENNAGTKVFALAGDSADNIPGAPGVGDKTARKLIAEFGDRPGGDVEEVLETLHRIWVGALYAAFDTSFSYNPSSSGLGVALNYEAFGLPESGFETTAVATAAVLLADPPDNFSVLSAHKYIPPVMEIVAEMPETRIEGFLAAGHAATITGSAVFEKFVERHGLPVVIADDPMTCVARGGGRVIELIDEHGPAVFGLE